MRETEKPKKKERKNHIGNARVRSDTSFKRLQKKLNLAVRPSFSHHAMLPPIREDKLAESLHETLRINTKITLLHPCYLQEGYGSRITPARKRCNHTTKKGNIETKENYLENCMYPVSHNAQNSHMFTQSSNHNCALAKSKKHSNSVLQSQLSTRTITGTHTLITLGQLSRSLLLGPFPASLTSSFCCYLPGTLSSRLTLLLLLLHILE